jgi:catechol 2,3-dioxygenase-like lactoylglutathione lyase family enzyme
VITGFGLVCLNVLDLDEAKAFYVDVLGFEVGIDREMDGFRWLTVHPPQSPELPMMLVVPEPPAIEEPVAGQMRTLLARGYLGLGALAVDDCRRTYAELEAKGVEMTEEPEERFYGVDAAFRDPFGNHWRLTQPRGLEAVRAALSGEAGGARDGGDA